VFLALGPVGSAVVAVAFALIATNAGATTQGEIVGALTATAAQQEHAGVATSPTSCVESYVLCTGKGPATSEIAPAFSPWMAGSGWTVTRAGDIRGKGDPSIRLGTASTGLLSLGNASVAEPSNDRGLRATAGRISSAPLDDYG